MSRMKALCLWSRENKVGLESLTNVPRNARFEGAVTPVMFSGDKKYYPAKIIMISDDDSALESRAAEVEVEIEKAKQSASVNTKRVKRNAMKVTKPGAASDRAIDVAVGARPSIPKELETAHKKAQAEKKRTKESLKVAQLSVDQTVVSNVRKTLFLPENPETGNESDNDEECVAGSVNDESEDDDFDHDEVKKDNRAEDESASKWCGCKPCQVFQKYDSPVYHNMLKEFFDLLSHQNASSKATPKYLELLPIPSSVKQVELTIGTNVFISASEKDQLKVDYRNKTASLTKETLFALFGKEVFRTLNVTGIGQKEGTYAIRDNVKQAIIGFVNRNVDKEKRLTTQKFNALINKRAPEWRRTPSPSQPKAKSKKRGKKSDEVVSPSPSKSPKRIPTPSPLKTPSKAGRGGTPIKTPRKSPHSKSPFRSPLKSPLKSPSKSPKRIIQASQSPVRTSGMSWFVSEEPPSFDRAMASLQAKESANQISMNYGYSSSSMPYPNQSHPWGYQPYNNFRGVDSAASYAPYQGYPDCGSSKGAPWGQYSSGEPENRGTYNQGAPKEVY